MSIADKLNYLLETKKAIKNALIKKGVGVSDTDTFKSYADKIEGIQAGSSDISGYFTDTISASNSSYFGWITAIKKYIPQLNVNTNGLAYFFAYYPNISIPKLNFTTDIKYMTYMFSYSKLKNIDFTEFAEGINTISVTDMSNMFYSCSELINLDINNFNTSNVTSMSSMFRYCRKLKTIPELNCSNIGNINSMCEQCLELTNFGGLENLGMAYLTTMPANYLNYKLSLNNSDNLTHTSLMNVINNLYDIATKGCKAQSLQLGATNIAKLTEEEIAIATSKGWTVS